jgi:hypothetical protein
MGGRAVLPGAFVATSNFQMKDQNSEAVEYEAKVAEFNAKADKLEQAEPLPCDPSER